MDSAQRERLAQHALGFSKADQTEVLVSATNSALTRFTHGVSNQNVASQDCAVSVRAIVGNRTGVAAGNATTDDALAALVARAQETAEFAPSDPLVPNLPGKATLTAPIGAYVARTATADPHTRATIVDNILRAADERNYWCAGFASTSTGGVTIANTSGALASFDGSDARANVKMTAPDSTGFAERYSTNVDDIDGTDVGTRAAIKAERTSKPQAVDPGDWTVILEPAAFGELLCYLNSHFSAQAYDEGSSFFSGELDKKFFSDGFTLNDDYEHGLAPGMPFDYEGQPKQRLALVSNGVVSRYVTDSYYSKKLGVENTGHALPAPNAWGPQALNLVVAPGNKSTDQLISETKRGLLISRFWYIRTVDQKQAIVTGMTRDGTFLIEDGKVKGGVRNLRFNQSILESLAKVEVASEQFRTGGYAYSLVTPAAKIAGFRFTSTTEF